jgi:hypothetical protein
MNIKLSTAQCIRITATGDSFCSLSLGNGLAIQRIRLPQNSGISELRMRWVGQIVCTNEIRNAYTTLIVKSEGKRQAPHHEDVLGSGGIAPRILNLGTNGDVWSASRSDRFTPG